MKAAQARGREMAVAGARILQRPRFERMGRWPEDHVERTLLNGQARR